MVSVRIVVLYVCVNLYHLHMEISVIRQANTDLNRRFSYLTDLLLPL